LIECEMYDYISINIQTAKKTFLCGFFIFCLLVFTFMLFCIFVTNISTFINE